MRKLKNLVALCAFISALSINILADGEIGHGRTGDPAATPTPNCEVDCSSFRTTSSSSTATGESFNLWYQLWLAYKALPKPF